MILQALVKRYEDTGEDSPGWQPRLVDYAINLDDNGDVLEIIDLTKLEGKRRVRRTYIMPEEPQGRTSGIKPAFLCDNAGYLFGADPKRGKEKWEKSAELHHRVLSMVDSEDARALLRYFSHQRMPENLAETGTYIFEVHGRRVHEDREVIDAWNSFRVKNVSSETIRCLVTGNQDTVATLHGKIALLGVSMGAVPLVSINAESFTSYGKTASDPAAAIGEEAAFAYTSALNALLKSNDHHQRIGGDTLVYWAEKGGEPEARAFSWFMKPGEDDSEKLTHIMKAIAQGEPSTIEGCELKKPFHLLCLSPNAGRISVRFFVSNTFGSILSNILKHYQALALAKSGISKFEFLPPWMLLSETTVKKKSSDAASLLGGQLLNSIVTGAMYPLTLYNAIIGRICAGEEVNRTKAAIIKAVLMRNYEESEVTTMALNPDSDNKPYVLGRLFAVLERLQQQAAGGSLNATIRDRYFSSASSNPGNVFPTLLKLSVHHSAKLDNAVYFEKLKTDLLGRLDEQSPFPTAFSLEDQGRFILGYYHQVQDFFTSKKDRENKED
ncbi:MAG: type I-C CRISPR-associated protein Cas8c/Csd1 [Coriobacteriales bacterium]|jgi:CRISPR-associated protein Csd1|nr:type I-C CRISPR-associated protein Cas8c/Csd1 [Coriobacteriales bacterium]